MFLWWNFYNQQISNAPCVVFLTFDDCVTMCVAQNVNDWLVEIVTAIFIFSHFWCRCARRFFSWWLLVNSPISDSIPHFSPVNLSNPWWFMMKSQKDRGASFPWFQPMQKMLSNLVPGYHSSFALWGCQKNRLSLNFMVQSHQSPFK